MKKDEFYVYFIVDNGPMAKNKERKLWVTQIVQSGKAILSSSDFEEAMQFDSPEEFRENLKNFSPPFNTHAYNIIKRKGKKEELIPLLKPAGTRANELKRGNIAVAVELSREARKRENKKGAVAEIWKLAAEGKTKKQLIEMGYNKNTVNRQYSEWQKSKNNESES